MQLDVGCSGAVSPGAPGLEQLWGLCAQPRGLRLAGAPPLHGPPQDRYWDVAGDRPQSQTPAGHRPCRASDAVAAGGPWGPAPLGTAGCASSVSPRPWTQDRPRAVPRPLSSPLPQETRSPSARAQPLPEGGSTCLKLSAVPCWAQARANPCLWLGPSWPRCGQPRGWSVPTLQEPSSLPRGGVDPHLDEWRGPLWIPPNWPLRSRPFRCKVMPGAAVPPTQHDQAGELAELGTVLVSSLGGQYSPTVNNVRKPVLS